MPKLSKRLIDELIETGGEKVVFDGKLPGFGVRVKASGVASFLVQYRNAAGRSRRLTLGRYGVLTAEEARTLARQHLADAASGKDPAQSKSAMRAAPTVSDLLDRYLTDHAEVHKKPTSITEDRRIIDRNLRPVVGKAKVADLTRADVAALHHGLRKTPYVANRVLAVLSKACSLAEVWGLRPDGSNPCRLVRRFREQARERFYSPDELSRLGAALGAAERNGSELPGVCTAIRLLALTGCRVGEILALRWDWLNHARGTIEFPDSKTGTKVVPLPAQAMLLLSNIHSAGHFVVHGMHNDRPLPRKTLKSGWRRLSKAAELQDARLHDLRHTVGTYAGHGGHNAFVVRDLLGHKSLAMTSRYVERDDDPVRAAADEVSDRIARAMDGETGEIVSMSTGG